MLVRHDRARGDPGRCGPLLSALGTVVVAAAAVVWWRRRADGGDPPSPTGW